ncbi:MAG: hypothetical protein NTW29_15145 [Bacteroidetes bacterium]|nr:hypothetical protein [Bacteroidota bacterium]
MENMVLEFSENDIEFKSLMVELYGEQIEGEYMTSNQFNGDLVDVIISIIIPITIPFLAVAYQKSLEKKKEDTKSKVKKVKFIKDGKEITFENYSVGELRSLLKENLKELNK